MVSNGTQDQRTTASKRAAKARKATTRWRSCKREKMSGGQRLAGYDVPRSPRWASTEAKGDGQRDIEDLDARRTRGEASVQAEERRKKTQTGRAPPEAAPSSSPVVRTLSRKASGRTSSGKPRHAQHGVHRTRSLPLDPSRRPDLQAKRSSSAPRQAGIGSLRTTD